MNVLQMVILAILTFNSTLTDNSKALILGILVGQLIVIINGWFK